MRFHNNFGTAVLTPARCDVFGPMLSCLYSKAPGRLLDGILLEPLLYEILCTLGLRGRLGIQVVFRYYLVASGSLVPKST